MFCDHLSFRLPPHFPRPLDYCNLELMKIYNKYKTLLLQSKLEEFEEVPLSVFHQSHLKFHFDWSLSRANPSSRTRV